MGWRGSEVPPALVDPAAPEMQEVILCLPRSRVHGLTEKLPLLRRVGRPGELGQAA